MRLGIVGGALQGTEIAYLAKQAGIKTLMIDKERSFPALPLADETAFLDIRRDVEEARSLLDSCDAVIPANENASTLSALSEICSRLSVPLMFDERAYAITSSKVRTNGMLRKVGVPMPSDWPDCGFPAVVKPSGSSGSHGVSRVGRAEEMGPALVKAGSYGQEIVIQEFVEGPSVSIEIIGTGTDAAAFTTTEIVLDELYDCKMVLCPPGRSVCDERELAEVGTSLAAELGLRGIMDVEAIVDKGRPKVLELDARFPSQTPMTVFHSTGTNLLAVLLEYYVTGEVPVDKPTRDRFAIFEHLRFKDGVLGSQGEAVMTDSPGLRIENDFFGADTALTDMAEPGETWRATVINTGRDEDGAWRKRDLCIAKIMDECGAEERYDSSPGRLWE